MRAVAAALLAAARAAAAPCDGVTFHVHAMPPLVPSNRPGRALDAPLGRPLLPCEDVMHRFQSDGGGCGAYENGHLGPAPPGGDFLGDHVWRTWQFSLAWLWHERVARHCAGPEEAADLVLVPYPFAEIHMATYYGSGKVFLSLETRRAYEAAVRSSLLRSARWRRCGGCDHVVVSARSFVEVEATAQRPRLGQFAVGDPFWANVSKLGHGAPLRGAADHVYGVPYATFLHPRSAADLDAWRTHALASPRTISATLVAGARSHRRRVVEACAGAADCAFVECVDGCAECCSPRRVVEAYLAADFCLVPPGDSPTRRAFFDALLAGCVPVLRTRATADYAWYTPPAVLRDVAVVAPRLGATNDSDALLAPLRALPRADVARMRRAALDLAQSLVYAADPDLGDAVDAGLRGLRRSRPDAFRSGASS